MSRIALYGENSIEYISILIDIWNAGDCAVLIDSETPSHAVGQMMMEAKVTKCFVQRKYYGKIAPHIEATVEINVYDADCMVSQILPAQIYAKFREQYSKNEAIIIYSSGTTGRSKGIILSHFSINTNADAIINYMQLTPKDCMYLVRKLAHSSTLTGELLVALKANIPILVAPTVVPPRYVLNNISKFNVSVLCTNPTLLYTYAHTQQQEDYNISALKKIYVSGSILGDKIYEFAHRVFVSQEIYNVYGLSEAAPRVAAQRKDCCKSNSVGKAIENVTIKIMNPAGEMVQKGERGIVHVNSPCLFSGYVNGGTKNSALIEGWLNTGDIGYFDQHDELHIVGRLDDLIILGAHKIYPCDVENWISSVPGVRECVVTMSSLDESSTLCCLYVAETDLKKDIIEKLRKVLLKYEIPKLFVKVDEIPKTRTGKISKRAVREILREKLRG